MGQKTHPYAFRLGIVNDWKSRWYSDKEYTKLVNEDWKIREYLDGELQRGAVSRIELERSRGRVEIELYTARPGVVIGRKGAEAERLRAGLEKLTGRQVKLNVNEIKDAETDARLLARGIADQIANRIAFRRAMKRAVQTAMKSGAEGVRVECKGRLGGSDMGRREWYREGRVPLHTLRADIDYGTATARTTVGAIGVKVWVYKGDVVTSLKATREKIAAEAALASGGPSRGRGRSRQISCRTRRRGREDDSPPHRGRWRQAPHRGRWWQAQACPGRRQDRVRRRARRGDRGSGQRVGARDTGDGRARDGRARDSGCAGGRRARDAKG